MVSQVHTHTNASLVTSGLVQGLLDYNPFLTKYLLYLISVVNYFLFS